MLASGLQDCSPEMTMKNTSLLIALGFLVIAIRTFSQTPSETKPAFEVASIKPNKSGDNRVSIGGGAGGRFVATGVPLRLLMTVAYRVRDFQISGGPDWLQTDRWDIEARAEEGSIPSPPGPPDPNVPDPMALRVQSLLEDRFQLKLHRETREMPVYELTVSKGGSKLKLSEDQNPFRPPERSAPPPPPPQRGAPMRPGSMRMGRGDLEAVGVSIPIFVNALSGQLGRTVIDRTGLKGLYDLKLQWILDFGPGAGPLGGALPAGVQPPTADPAGPSIFTAVQEQLGLRLESTKGPVEVILVDSVEKPTEN
jgi:bla regulator protein blaR1